MEEEETGEWREQEPVEVLDWDSSGCQRGEKSPFWVQNHTRTGLIISGWFYLCVSFSCFTKHRV